MYGRYFIHILGVLRIQSLNTRHYQLRQKRPTNNKFSLRKQSENENLKLILKNLWPN